jgi:hypothetical protein
MSDVIDLPEIEPASTEVEGCELCGCAIEDLEELIYLRAADLVAQWERGDPRDNWKYTGEHPPRKQPPTPAPTYCTPQATIDAFMFVARNHDAAYIARWLENHPRDVATLTKIWEAKNGIS